MSHPCTDAEYRLINANARLQLENDRLKAELDAIRKRCEDAVRAVDRVDMPAAALATLRAAGLEG